MCFNEQNQLYDLTRLINAYYHLRPKAADLER